jgi:hypothetical protein
MRQSRLVRYIAWGRKKAIGYVGIINKESWKIEKL